MISEHHLELEFVSTPSKIDRELGISELCAEDEEPANL